MWGALSRLFVKNENPSVDGEINESMDKQASHQDMDTLEAKQVSFYFASIQLFHSTYESVVDFVTYLKYHLQFPCK